MARTERALAHIPYGAYWSTPFARWQGSYAQLNSVEFAAHVTRKELARRRVEDNAFVTRVLEQPKVWLIGGEDDLAA